MSALPWPWGCAEASRAGGGRAQGPASPLPEPCPCYRQGDPEAREVGRHTKQGRRRRLCGAGLAAPSFHQAGAGLGLQERAVHREWSGGAGGAEVPPVAAASLALPCRVLRGGSAGVPPPHLCPCCSWAAGLCPSSDPLPWRDVPEEWSSRAGRWEGCVLSSETQRLGGPGRGPGRATAWRQQGARAEWQPVWGDQSPVLKGTLGQSLKARPTDQAPLRERS